MPNLLCAQASIGNNKAGKRDTGIAVVAEASYRNNCRCDNNTYWWFAFKDIWSMTPNKANQLGRKFRYAPFAPVICSVELDK